MDLVDQWLRIWLDMWIEITSKPEQQSSKKVKSKKKFYLN